MEIGLVERAARAAAEVVGYNWQDLPALNPVANGELDQRHFRDMVRAALNVVRDDIDNGGFAEGARQMVEREGSEAAQIAVDAFEVIVAELDQAIAEDARAADIEQA